jgi:hypothetical protein
VAEGHHHHDDATITEIDRGYPPVAVEATAPKKSGEHLPVLFGKGNLPFG